MISHGHTEVSNPLGAKLSRWIAVMKERLETAEHEMDRILRRSVEDELREWPEVGLPGQVIQERQKGLTEIQEDARKPLLDETRCLTVRALPVRRLADNEYHSRSGEGDCSASEPSGGKRSDSECDVPSRASHELNRCTHKCTELTETRLYYFTRKGNRASVS